MDKKTVVIATPLYPPEIGGPATFAKLAEERLPALGWEVRLVKFSEVNGWPKVLKHLAYAWLVFRRSRGVDAVLALDPMSVGLPAMTAAFLARKPYAVRIVGDYAWEQGVQRFGVMESLDDFASKRGGYHWLVRIFKLVQTAVARRAEKIFTPSLYLKRIVTSWGVEEGKIGVIYNAFALGYDPVGKEEVRLIKKLDGLVLFSAGRLVPWKGFPVLIEAVGRLAPDFPSLKLLIAGDGPEEKNLKRQIAERGLEDRVSLLGRLPKEELAKYVRAADLFVLNTGYEGFSHQLLEVMALGTPIVTTAVGGNPELIEHGRQGLLVECGDVDALTDSIRVLLEHPGEAAKLARNAQEKADRFTEERLIEGVDAFLRSL